MKKACGTCEHALKVIEELQTTLESLKHRIQHSKTVTEVPKGDGYLSTSDLCRRIGITRNQFGNIRMKHEAALPKPSTVGNSLLWPPETEALVAQFHENTQKAYGIALEKRMDTLARRM